MRLLGTRRILFVVALSASVMTACGSNDDTPTLTPTTVGVTKDEYIRQGDAICRELQSKVASIPDQENVSPQEALSLSERFLAAAQPEFERLKALKAPPADSATVSQLNGYLDEILLRLNEQIAAARARRGAAYDAASEARAAVTEQYRQLAKQYGFAVCGT